MTIVLTEREDQVAYLLKIRDMTQRQVAAVLAISPRTVEMHVASIRRKAGTSTTATALARVSPRGLGLSVASTGIPLPGNP